MIPQTILAVLLSAPLVAMLIPSIGYWKEFRKEKQAGKTGRKTRYKSGFFFLLVAGVLCMWISWLGGITLLFIGKYYSVVGFLTFSAGHEGIIQIIGLLIFYIGAITYNVNIVVAGKYLRPAPSGLLRDQKLIQEGPYRIIRHPLYMSYVFILAGLSLSLLTYWLLIPTLLIIIGIYPTAKAEEETLIEHFGDEYIAYQKKVGMLFPRLF